MSNTDPNSWTRTSAGVWKNKKTGETLTGQAGNPATRGKYASGSGSSSSSSKSLLKGVGDPTLKQLTPQMFKALAGGNQTLADSFTAGVPLADLFFSQGSLGRLNETLPQGYTDALGQMGSQYQASLQEDPRITQQLQQLQQLFQQASVLSPEEQQLIALRQQNLPGLTQAEEQLMLDRGQQGLNRGLSTALSATRSAFPGATGPASSLAARPAMASFADSQRQLLNDVSQTKFDRSREALGNYENTVRGINTDLFNRSSSTGTLANQATQAQNQFAAQNQNQRLQALFGGQFQAGQDQLQRQAFNLGQFADERAGQLGLIFGSGQVGAAEQSRKDALALGREQLAAAKSAASLASIFRPQVVTTNTYGV